MLSLFLCLSSSKGSGTNIFQPTTSIQEDTSKTFDTYNEREIVNFLFPYVGQSSAYQLAKKMKFTKTTSIDSIVFGPVTSTGALRCFKRFNTLLHLTKNTDGKLTVKLMKLATECWVQSVETFDIKPYPWRPLSGDEVAQVYNTIDIAAKPTLQSAIKKIKE